MLHVGDARHLDFDGRRDLLLNLFGGASRPLRDHLDIVVGDVGIGLDRKVVERHSAPTKEQDGCPQDEPSIVQREINQASDHLWIYSPGECEGVLIDGGNDSRIL